MPRIAIESVIRRQIIHRRNITLFNVIKIEMLLFQNVGKQNFKTSRHGRSQGGDGRAMVPP